MEQKWNRRGTSLTMAYKLCEIPEKLEYVILHLINDMTEDDAKNTAEYVMNFLGYEGRVPDDWLETDDRDSFNSLEDANILKIDYTTVSLYTGRERNVYIWGFTNDFLSGRLEKEIRNRQIKTERLIHEKPETSIYETLSKEQWRRTSINSVT